MPHTDTSPASLTDPETDTASPITTHPFDVDGDKLKEECGVFGVIGVEQAANFVAPGLHAEVGLLGGHPFVSASYGYRRCPTLPCML